jgi:hypothetical protein
MNFKMIASSLIVAAMSVAPAFANSARAIYCSDSDFFSEGGFSGFFSDHVHGGLVWSGGALADCDDEVGVRIDTLRHGSGAFQLVSYSTGNACPQMFYIYTTDGSNRITCDYGIVEGDNVNGVRHWSFNGVGHGAAMVSIYFVDYGGSSYDVSYCDTVYPPHVDGGPPVPITPHSGPQYDCASD